MYMHATRPKRTLTFTSSNILDADAIKTTIATATVAIVYIGVELNGVVPSTGLTLAGHSRIAQYPSVTCSDSAGAFTAGSSVVFTGTYGGDAVTRTATILSANGNATYIADGPVDVASVTAITVAAQATTGGTFTFGLTDLACNKKNGKLLPFLGVRAAAAGNVAVTYSGGYSEVLVMAAAESEDMEFERVIAATTAVGIRVYL